MERGFSCDGEGSEGIRSVWLHFLSSKSQCGHTKFKTIYFSLVRRKGTHKEALGVEGRSNRRK